MATSVGDLEGHLFAPGLPGESGHRHRVDLPCVTWNLPQADNISRHLGHYRDIDPLFGDLAAFDRLVARARARYAHL